MLKCKDRVVFKRDHPKNDHWDDLIGCRATVVSINRQGHVIVEWDDPNKRRPITNDNSFTWSKACFDVIDEDAEMKEAHKTLSRYGAVTFVPRFKPVLVHFCALGDVIVNRDYAEMNGYRIEFEAINKLHAEVQRAGNKLFAD